MASRKDEKKSARDKALDLLKRHLDVDVTGYKMAQDTGITEATISNWRKGLSNPSPLNANIVIDYFESGEYLNKSDNASFTVKNEVVPVPYDKYKMVEYVDLRAAAGRIGVGEVENLPDTHRRLVPIEFENGKYLVVRVTGDSMDDGTKRSLSDGDEVLVREVSSDGWSELPIRNRLFVITSREGHVIKQIKEVNAEEGYFICHSFNSLYEDFKIYFQDIYQVFVVYKVVQKQISLI